MCGIVGWVTKDPVETSRIQSVLRMLKHRGPDGNGVWLGLTESNAQVGLLHTRLSIIDLSAGGHQPMHSADGRYSIVFNGEIYNYRELRQELRDSGHTFLSESDTEVLLAAWVEWGEECLRRLVGMFAFTVYDRDEQTLTLVRDAFGIKPLFYGIINETLVFASEVPALLALLPKHPKLNLQRAYDYLVHGVYDDQEQTFFEEVLHLPPGHILRLSLPLGVEAEPVRWWWPSITERTDLSFEQAADELRERFLASVRLHLRSDVPLGAALSGGVDSSAVVCAMRYLEPKMPIHTFTYVASGTSVDEEHWADLVNNHVDAIPHKVVVDPKELAADLDAMIQTQGEPFGSTSIYAQYRVFRAARQAGITVTLDGQGADELLGGYWGYPGSTMRSMVDKGNWLALPKFLWEWSRWPGRSLSYGAKVLVSPFVPNALRGLALRVIGKNPAPDWLNVNHLAEQGIYVGGTPLPLQNHDAPGRRLMDALRLQLTGDGLGSLLRHGDRDSMCWSVESRVPFLTTEIAEYCLSLPEHFLVSFAGETKHVFRESMRGIVPDKILNRKDKIGFATPEQSWLRELGDQVIDWLEPVESLPFLNARACHEEVASIIDGRKPFTFQAWRLINFCRWSQFHAGSL